MGYFNVTGFENEVESTVGAFIANLPETLGQMNADPRTIIAVGELADHRYVQFWSEPDGHLFSEVLSNFNIGNLVALTPENEDALRAMGWLEPSKDNHPNWLFESDGADGLMTVVLMIKRVLLEVFGEEPGNPIWIRSWDFEKPLGTEDTLAVRCEARVHYQNSLRQIATELGEAV